MRRRTWHWLTVLALTLATVVACDPGAPAIDATTPDPTTAAVTPAMQTPPAANLDIFDPAEAERVRSALEGAGYAVLPGVEARLSDRPIDGGTEHVLTAWALVAHPRVERLDLSRAEADAILGDEVTAWEQLDPGARALPLALYVSTEAEAWYRREYGQTGGSRATFLPTEALIARVAAEPGAVGLVPYEAPVLGVLALTIDGHDPYRDPAATAPLADRRWVRADSEDEASRLAALAGWATVLTYDPAGIVATGEHIPARCVQATLARVGYEAMFEDVRDLVTRADYAIAPWEPSIVDDEPTPCVLTFNLQAAPEAAEAAAAAGFDLAFTVGNHLGDCWTGCGAPGAVLSTVRTLQAAGLATVGAGEDLAEATAMHTEEIDGVTFAFLAYDDIAREFYGATDDYAGTNPLDLDRLAEEVRAAKAVADHVIVGFSWGVEYEADPSSRQVEASRIAMEAGASLIVGNHPHWVQATERIGDGMVLYALGNFVFDQNWSVETQQGLLVEAGFSRDRLLGVRLRPVMIRDWHRPEFVSPASPEGRAILDQVWGATGRRPRAAD
ncbi:MAG: CapA family protein [Dehalococcoidia bacterium]|nr:CapA family protein [Dehalococcoidia bacterium]